MKLSHSRLNRFQECPTSYKYYYVDNLRPAENPSAFVFGKAIDDAINLCMDNIQRGIQTDSGVIEMFENTWLNNSDPKINALRYNKSDLDLKLAPTEREGLLIKGKLMLGAFLSDFVPEIQEVLGFQIPVSLKNDDGDEVIGFADAVLKLKGYDKPIVIDFKTASRDYDPTSVNISAQLHTYVAALSPTYENTRLAGFVVLSKSLIEDRVKICTKCGNDGSTSRAKTCDRVHPDCGRCSGEWKSNSTFKSYVQVIINEANERMEEIVLDNYFNISLAIKGKMFHRNFQSCINKYNKVCPYYNLCYKKDKTGLTEYVEPSTIDNVVTKPEGVK